MGKPRADYSLPANGSNLHACARAQVGRKTNQLVLFSLSFCGLQLHPELSALPQQHDGGGLHDGAGCRLPARHRRPPRAQVSVSRRLPGKAEERQKINGQTKKKKKKRI